MSRLRDDTGAVGGLEVLPFGVLVFVVGTLLVLNAWGVIDAKFAVAGAARQAVRAFVEAPAGSADPWALARDAAEDAMRAHGRRGPIIFEPISGRLERCAVVTLRVGYRIDALRLPWIGGLGNGFVASSVASERVDPLRSGLAGEAGCVGP